jgi:hypothetical protein
MDHRGGLVDELGQDRAVGRRPQTIPLRSRFATVETPRGQESPLQARVSAPTTRPRASNALESRHPLCRPTRVEGASCPQATSENRTRPNPPAWSS